MYLVIGREGCSRCEMIKNILTNKNIKFEYELFETFNQEDKDKYLNMAKQAKLLAMPIIIQNDKVIDFKEVI
jgi:glutaredoxin